MVAHDTSREDVGHADLWSACSCSAADPFWHVASSVQERQATVYEGATPYVDYGVLGMLHDAAFDIIPV